MTERLIELAPCWPLDEPVRWTDAVPVLPAEQLQRQRPDVHLVLLGSNGAAAARCSLWHTSGPQLNNQPTGCIGHLAAADEHHGTRLLALAAERLAARGCIHALAPLDGSTWRRYRAVVEPGNEPPFALEPENPPFWPSMLERAGFSPAAWYTSALDESLAAPAPDAHAALTAAALRQGITLRQLDLSDPERALRELHAVSLAGFVDNFLYTPLDWDEFRSMYEPLLSLVRPELTWLAQHDGESIGFSFSIPDLAEARRTGGPARTIIFKSLAVVPPWRGVGLGKLLIAHGREAARAAGFRRAVFALMHDQSRSGRIAASYGPTIRRYALYARRLAT